MSYSLTDGSVRENGLEISHSITTFACSFPPLGHCSSFSSACPPPYVLSSSCPLLFSSSFSSRLARSLTYASTHIPISITHPSPIHHPRSLINPASLPSASIANSLSFTHPHTSIQQSRLCPLPPGDVDAWPSHSHRYRRTTQHLPHTPSPRWAQPVLRGQADSE